MNTNNLTPTLVTKARRTKAKRYDCGKYGRLTVREIARLAGVSTHAIYGRIWKGVTGDALLDAKYEGLQKPRKECSNSTIKVAMKLARHFQGRVPTPAEIIKAQPMTLRSAQRWRQALAEAA